jgi:hypothetical protein
VFTDRFGSSKPGETGFGDISGYFCPGPSDPNYDSSIPCDKDGANSIDPSTLTNYNPASTSAENLGFDESRFTYPEQVIITTPITGVITLDNDCATIAPSVRESMAQAEVDNGNYPDLRTALENLDCMPAGRH